MPGMVVSAVLFVGAALAFWVSRCDAHPASVVQIVAAIVACVLGSAAISVAAFCWRVKWKSRQSE